MTTNTAATHVASRIGAARGALSFANMAQDAKHPAKLELRKWLSANGVSSSHAAKLSFAEIEHAWNDTSDAALAMLRAVVVGAAPAAPANNPFNGAPVMPAPAAPVAGNPLDGLMAYINAHIAGSVNEDRVRAIVDEALSGVAPRVIDVKQGEVTIARIAERTNKVFERVVKLAARNRNILLVGPAGCGKTHLAAQVAKALGRRFGMISGSAGASESQLTGWLLPEAGGAFEHRASDFIECYEGGNSTFLLDEYDAFDPNMVLVANAALSNGYFMVPQRTSNPRVNKGENVNIIATANTFGTGADPIYSGRNAMDGASNDRFKLIEITYDRDLEMEIGQAHGIGKSQMADFFSLRDKVEKAGLLRIISTRALFRVIDDMECGLAFEAALEEITTGWSADEKQRVGF
jgi:MoxR-like ATPase